MLDAEIRARDIFERRLRNRPLECALHEGEIAGPARPSKPVGRYDCLDVSGYYCRFRKGDRAELRTHVGGGRTEYFTEVEIHDVTFPAVGIVRLAISRKRNPIQRPRVGEDYFIYPSQSTFADELLRERIGSARLVRLAPSRLDHLLTVPGILDPLNDGQREALRYLCELGTGGCVQGPPGTGKTATLHSLVRAALESRLRVGVAAFTHAAVDNALAGLVLHLRDGCTARIGATKKVRSELYPPGWLKRNAARSFRDAPDVLLYAATTHAWLLTDNAPAVDLLVVDEAGQVPAYMAATLHELARRVICLGDHRQLPPVLQGHHADVQAVDMFSCLIDNTTPMLDTQYRMNRVIQSWSAVRYYDGRLWPDASNADRDVLRGVAPEVLGSTPVRLASHDQVATNDAKGIEAYLVAEEIARLADSGGLAFEDIGVIAPHRVHNGAILRALQERFGVTDGAAVQVDTVERFQGRQKEVILFALGADSSDLSGRSAEFLGDPRRLNVAVTRARSRFVCFANGGFVSAARGEIREFLEWCVDPDTVRSSVAV